MVLVSGTPRLFLALYFIKISNSDPGSISELGLLIMILAARERVSSFILPATECTSPT